MSSTNTYEFTHDWTTDLIPVWETYIKDIPVVNMLEVGAYEGRTTVWAIENILPVGGTITCIDNWTWDIGIEPRFYKNLVIAKEQYPDRKCIVLKGDSNAQLGVLNYTGKKYDLVYVDSSSEPKDRILDAYLSWNLLEHGGVLIIDDYMYTTDSNESMKTAVDTFCIVFRNYIKILYIGKQVVIQKL